VTKTGISPDATAGHSLGEYGALVAAQCISIETSAKLIAKRAGLMEQAPAGAMSAVLGLPYEVIETVIARLLQTYPNAITVANYNTADQAVISGSVEAVQAAAEPLKAAGAKRVLPLPVGGAFHSPLMQQAAVEFLDTLNKETFQMPICPVISNVDAAPSSSPADLQNKLGRQIDNSVLWAQTMAEMVDVMGVTRVFEFGPGKVLTGMMRKAYPQVQVYNIFDSASLDEVCAQVQNTDPIGAIH
jgi:[acyl-carrier-protein] S-malonyltransferase